MRPPAFGPTTGISTSVSYNVACSSGGGAAAQWYPELTAADDLTQRWGMPCRCPTS